MVLSLKVMLKLYKGKTWNITKVLSGIFAARSRKTKQNKTKTNSSLFRQYQTTISFRNRIIYFKVSISFHRGYLVDYIGLGKVAKLP